MNIKETLVVGVSAAVAATIVIGIDKASKSIKRKKKRAKKVEAVAANEPAETTEKPKEVQDEKTEEK